MNSDKLIVALDVDSLERAKELVDKLSPAVKIFKIGSELFTACGERAIGLVHDKGCEVFLDLKFHDIPNTVSRASRVTARQKVFMFNVHALGGMEMMRGAVESAKQESEKQGIRKPLILGVTVLTSLDRGALNQLGIMRGVRREVVFLAKLAKKAGLDGVVASPKEIRYIRDALGSNFIIVTPGIRPPEAKQEDQKRVTTPREAISEGADYIVVGRPITEAEDPLKAAENILEEIS